MNLSNLSAVEAIWSGASIVALFVTAWLLYQAHGDLMAVRRSGENGLFRGVAVAQRRRCAFKASLAALFVAAGLYAGLFVPPPEGPSAPLPLSVIFLMAADIVLVMLSLESARERIFIMGYLQKWHPTER